MPRASGIGVFGVQKGHRSRPSGVPTLISEIAETSGSSGMMQLTDKEIDERVRGCSYSGSPYPLLNTDR